MNVYPGTRVTNLLIVISVALGIALLVAHRHLGAQAQDTAKSAASHDVASEVVSYAEQGRYDKAVELGLHSLKNQPSDEFIYQQIADVYLIRARREPGRRRDWISKAIMYTDKALSLNSRDKDPAGAELFQIGRSYEFIADLSTDNRCSRYTEAQKLLKSREPMLQGDQIIREGRTFPLAPLRAENQRVLGKINEKARKANCLGN
jgi:tetratricopeptide (TPR) repeat protein